MFISKQNCLLYFNNNNLLIFFFNPLLHSRKMVRYTLKILQQMLQDFQSVSDRFMTLQSKWLMNEW